MITFSQITDIFNQPQPDADIPIKSVSIDTRTLTPGSIYVALKGHQFDGHHFIEQAKEKGAVAAIISQPISASIPTIKVSDTLKALTQLAYHYRSRFRLPVVGLTGSCGKTSTKALIHAILSLAGNTLATEGTLNNHIGVPLMLLRLNEQYHYAVFEMGANHLQEISHLTHLVQPDIALITNIGPVHLEGFGSIEGVAKGKGEIFEGLSAEGVAIINKDDPYADTFAALNPGRKILYFGQHPHADIRAEAIGLNSKGEPSFELHTPEKKSTIQLKLLGEHQVMNALAAASVGYALNIDFPLIKKALESSQAVNKRLCFYKGRKGEKIIDDSYNANPFSTLAALKVLAKQPNKRIFIFGDMMEMGDNAQHYHEQIGQTAKLLGIHQLYTLGHLAQHASQAFGEQGFHFNNQTDLIHALSFATDPNTTLLIKGSNSMQMWNITDKLR